MLIERCFLIGAGGHAKVVYEALRMVGVSGIDIWDDNTALNGNIFMDSTVHAPIRHEQLPACGHVAIGHTKNRQRMSEQLKKQGLRLLSVLHPSAVISDYSRVKEGVFIAAQAILAADSQVERGVIINHSAIVDHECKIGAFSHIAPHATLGGGAVVGDRCLIGAGAVLLPEITLANDVTVGAGAVVTSSINQAGVTVRGVPAK